MDLIKEMKENLAQFSYLSPERQKILIVAEKKNCLHLLPNGTWHHCSMFASTFRKDVVYHLRPKYMPKKDK